MNSVLSLLLSNLFTVVLFIKGVLMEGISIGGDITYFLPFHMAEFSDSIRVALIEKFNCF